jgi:hypothetical protein
MTENTLPTLRLCKNCSTQLHGNFCAVCGQADKDVKRPLLNLLKELVHAIFELDGRAYRTLLFLFIRPGYLSKEYVEGRRASYTPPLRLFLILSILLFFTLSFNSFIDGLDSSMANGGAEPEPQQIDGVASPVEPAQQPDNQASLGNGLEVVVDSAEEDIDSELEEIEEVFSQLVVPFVSTQANSRLVSFIISQTETNYRRIREDPTEFLYSSLEYITVFLLLMMPLMAVIQAIMYIGSRRYYVEHFVLTLHNHTFLILAAIVMLPLGAAEASSIGLVSAPAGLLNVAVNIWIVVYLFLSMKRFYGGGYLLTALKFFTATVTYSVLLAVGLAIFMAINFILF